jgi:hypothetical protein
VFKIRLIAHGAMRGTHAPRHDFFEEAGAAAPATASGECSSPSALTGTSRDAGTDGLVSQSHPKECH